MANDESLTAQLFARLKGGMSTTRMPYGQREPGISLHRHFLMRQQYEPLANRSQILGGAFDKVAAAMLADPVLMDRVGMRERERRLALMSPGYLPPAINTRLDAFVNDDQINFVEYNAENLSSLMDQAGLNQVLFEIRALELLAERSRVCSKTDEKGEDEPPPRHPSSATLDVLWKTTTVPRCTVYRNFVSASRKVWGPTARCCLISSMS